MAAAVTSGANLIILSTLLFRRAPADFCTICSTVWPEAIGTASAQPSEHRRASTRVCAPVTTDVHHRRSARCRRSQPASRGRGAPIPLGLALELTIGHEHYRGPRWPLLSCTGLVGHAVGEFLGVGRELGLGVDGLPGDGDGGLLQRA